MAQASRDQNFVTTLLGVDHVNFITPTLVGARTDTHELLTRSSTTLPSGVTIASAGGSVSSNGNNTLLSAGTNRLKVMAYSLSTTSTTAVTCIFQDGASGTTLWEVILQAPSSVSTGANLATPYPSFLFATSTATLLNLNLSSGQTVYWSVAYRDEA